MTALVQKKYDNTVGGEPVVYAVLDKKELLLISDTEDMALDLIRKKRPKAKIAHRILNQPTI